jgi:hypothetical protein
MQPETQKHTHTPTHAELGGRRELEEGKERPGEESKERGQARAKDWLKTAEKLWYFNYRFARVRSRCQHEYL